MCSKAVSHVKMWSREGLKSAENASFPLVVHCAEDADVDFLTFCVAVEDF